MCGEPAVALADITPAENVSYFDIPDFPRINTSTDKESEDPTALSASPLSKSPLPVYSAQQSKEESAPTFYVVGDRTLMIQKAINANGGKILQVLGWQAFRSSRNPVGRRLLSSLQVDKPTVLWIHLDCRQAYAQAKLHTTSTSNVTSLVSEQDRDNRMVVIEGS